MQETYVDIMIQSLKKKLSVLNKIVELNKKQKIALEDPGLTPDDFDDLVEAKSDLVDQLDKLDSGFEKLFERVKDELENNKQAHATEIKTMQDYIRKITDCSVEIQAQEARNKDLMVKKFTSVKKQVRQKRTSSQVASKYYQNMAKLNYVDPQLFDNKSK